MDILVLIGGPLLFLGVVQLIFGIFCLAKTRRGNFLPLHAGLAAVVSGFYCATIGTAYIRSSLHLDYSIAYRLGWIGWFLPALFSRIIFELRSRKSQVVNALIWAQFPFWALVNYFVLTTNKIDIEPESFAPYIDRGGPFEILLRWVGAFSLALAFYLVFRMRIESRGHKRLQTGYLILGASFFGAGGLVASCGMFGITTIDPGLSSYLSLPWIGLTMYAVLKHRLFDIRPFVSQLISSAALIFVCTGVHLGLSQLLAQAVGVGVGNVLSAFFTAVFVFALPIIRWTRALVDRFVLRKTYDYQTAIKKSAEAMVSLLNLDDLLRKFIEMTRKSIGVQVADFYMLDEKHYVLRYSVGHATPVDPTKLPLDSALVERLTKDRQVFILDEQEPEHRGKLKALKIELAISEAEAAVPVFYKNLLVGFLTLGPKANKDAFLQEDIDFLQTLASQAAVAIENARLFAESTTDGLTGLYHQKFFKSRLKAEYERATRHGHSLILLLVDIDHFKKVNDTYGHLVGDSILRGVAKIVHNSFRIEDVVARYGGEEFAVLLNEPNTKSAKNLAERIRRKVEGFTFDKNIHVTVSIGMFVFDKTSDCKSDTDLIHNADEALYKAKQTGRNKVVYFEEVSKIRLVK